MATKVITKKAFKVGDKVTTFLMNSSWEKRKVTGKIKEVKSQFGRTTYIITGGIVEDFPTRSLK